MAKIQEEIVVIRLSKLIKDTETVTTLTGKDFAPSLEAIVQELLDSSIIVEVEKQ
jgi:hypothetical protein